MVHAARGAERVVGDCKPVDAIQAFGGNAVANASCDSHLTDDSLAPQEVSQWTFAGSLPPW
jgi:hypothetical protein